MEAYALELTGMQPLDWFAASGCVRGMDRMVCLMGSQWMNRLSLPIQARRCEHCVQVVGATVTAMDGVV